MSWWGWLLVGFGIGAVVFGGPLVWLLLGLQSGLARGFGGA